MNMINNKTTYKRIGEYKSYNKNYIVWFEKVTLPTSVPICGFIRASMENKLE